MSKIGTTIKRKLRRYCYCVVLAAGDSKRMGEDKLDMTICGKTVLQLCLENLSASDYIDEIVVVTREDKVEHVAALCGEMGLKKVKKVVIGGKTRTESALAGVSETSKKAKVICIHDGARPFVTEDVITDAVQKAVAYKAAAPAVKVKDTLKETEKGVVTSTPDRENLYAVQTPQAFDADVIKLALTSAVGSGLTYTDDCAAVEALGISVRLSRGSESNIKITTPVDIVLGEAIFKSMEEKEE